MKHLTTTFFQQITVSIQETTRRNIHPAPLSRLSVAHRKKGQEASQRTSFSRSYARPTISPTFLAPRGLATACAPRPTTSPQASAHVCCTSPAALQTHDAGSQWSCISPQPTSSRNSRHNFLLHVVCRADTFKSLDHRRPRKPHRRWPVGEQLHDAVWLQITNCNENERKLKGDGSASVI